MLCPSCRKMIPDGVRYCPFCGENTRATAEGPATFNDNEDFLAGTVPRYEDSGASWSDEEPAPAPSPAPERFPEEPGFDAEATINSFGNKPAPSSEIFDDATEIFDEKPELFDDRPDLFDDRPAVSEEPPATVTSMYGELYNASDARYSQSVELSGLNLLTPADSGDDPSNRRTAIIVMSIFGALAAIVLGVCIFLISRGLGNLSLPSGGYSPSGNGLWDFLVRPRPSYAGYDESQNDWFTDDWTDTDDDDDFWDDDFWEEDDGSGSGYGNSDSFQTFDPGTVPVQTPEMTAPDFEEYLAGYTRPEELGEDLYSGFFRFEGDLYQLPAPISEFIANGWTITELQGVKLKEGAAETIPGGAYNYISMQREDKELGFVTIHNPYKEDRPLEDTVLIDIHCDLGGYYLLDLPGLPSDADKDTADAFIKKYDFTKDEERDYIVYYLCFSPSREYTDNFGQNWVTLYDYDKDGRIDSLSLNYNRPFKR